MASIKEITTEEAERLKVFRKAEGLSQETFAAKLGTVHSIISRYECGRLNIPIDFIKEMHRVYNLSLTWFFTGKGNRKHIEEKSNLVTDVKTIATNQDILQAQIEGMKHELLKLHRDFHAFKNNVK